MPKKDFMIVVVITFNRLAYTKKTMAYLLKTITVPHYIIVVDNGSSDGTQNFIKQLKSLGHIDDFILNATNHYPGKACNMGWEKGLQAHPEANYLVRLDNDTWLAKGWDTNAISYFNAIDNLGQLGLDNEVMDIPASKGHETTINGKTINPWPGNVGGQNIIKREVWDKGIRYDETPWHHDGGNIPTAQEDSKFSADITHAGYLIGHVAENLSRTFANPSNWKDYPDYYKKTMTERGFNDMLRYI